MRGSSLPAHIFRGDIERGTAELFIEVPEDEHRRAVGMVADVAHELLFVAGDEYGKAYVYSTRTKAACAEATVATYQLTDASMFVKGS